MTTAGEMVAKVAELFEFNLVTLSTIDRVLSNAGLRSKGGRGRAGAQMTGRDIAHLVIAVIYGVGMKEAPDFVAKMSKLPKGQASIKRAATGDSLLDQFAEGTDWEFALDPVIVEQAFPSASEIVAATTFGAALALVIDGLANNTLAEIDNYDVKVRISNRGPKATIDFRDGKNQMNIFYIPSRNELEHPVYIKNLVLEMDLLLQLAGIIRKD